MRVVAAQRRRRRQPPGEADALLHLGATVRGARIVVVDETVGVVDEAAPVENTPGHCIDHVLERDAGARDHRLPGGTQAVHALEHDHRCTIAVREHGLVLSRSWQEAERHHALLAVLAGVRNRGSRRDRRRGCAGSGGRNRRAEHVDQATVGRDVCLQAVPEHRDPVHLLDVEEMVRPVDVDVVPDELEPCHRAPAQAEDAGVLAHIAECDRRRRGAARAGQEVVQAADHPGSRGEWIDRHDALGTEAVVEVVGRTVWRTREPGLATVQLDLRCRRLAAVEEGELVALVAMPFVLPLLPSCRCRNRKRKHRAGNADDGENAPELVPGSHCLRCPLLELKADMAKAEVGACRPRASRRSPPGSRHVPAERGDRTRVCTRCQAR